MCSSFSEISAKSLDKWQIRGSGKKVGQDGGVIADQLGMWKRIWNSPNLIVLLFIYIYLLNMYHIYIYTYFSLFLINFDCFQCDFEWFMLRVCHRCCQGTHAVHRPFGPRKTPLAKLPTETRPEVRPSLWQALLCIVNFVLYKCHCCAVGWVFWCIQVVLGCLWLPSALKKVFLLSWSLSLNRSRISSRLVHRRIWQNNQNYSEL